MSEPTMTCVDNHGGDFEIVVYTQEDRDALIEMYDRFSPKAVTQGLPPADKGMRLVWIESLVSGGPNLVAKSEGKVIGHSSLILDMESKEGEFLIFVDHTCRNKGLGTGLTKAAVEKATGLGISAIWLTVEALNFRAIRLYKKMGFVFCDSGERERVMVLKTA